MRLPEHAEHGVVGPAGTHRPGPRGRLPRGRRLALAGLLAVVLGWTLAPNHEPSGTEALFTSRAVPQHNAITGGTWAPDPPAACGDLSRYAAVVYGTQGDDVLAGGNHPQIIMGLAGDDVITGGNSGDCLVGGAGNDRLVGGNAKDILLGGPGNDKLDGGNAKDYLDGEDDADECDGGNGKDDVVNCDPPIAPVAPLRAPAQQPHAATTETTPAAPEVAPAPSPPADTTSGDADDTTPEGTPTTTETADPEVTP